MDLIESPVFSCPDVDDDCDVLFGKHSDKMCIQMSLVLYGNHDIFWWITGEKTTKIFAMDSQSGEVKWMNSDAKVAQAQSVSKRLEPENFHVYVLKTLYEWRVLRT